MCNIITSEDSTYITYTKELVIYMDFNCSNEINNHIENINFTLLVIKLIVSMKSKEKMTQGENIVLNYDINVYLEEENKFNKNMITMYKRTNRNCTDAIKHTSYIYIIYEY